MEFLENLKKTLENGEFNSEEVKKIMEIEKHSLKYDKSKEVKNILYDEQNFDNNQDKYVINEYMNNIMLLDDVITKFLNSLESMCMSKEILVEFVRNDGDITMIKYDLDNIDYLDKIITKYQKHVKEMLLKFKESEINTYLSTFGDYESKNDYTENDKTKLKILKLMEKYGVNDLNNEI